MTPGPQDDGGAAAPCRTAESRGKVPMCRHTLPRVGQRNHCHLSPDGELRSRAGYPDPPLQPHSLSSPHPQPGDLPFPRLSCEGLPGLRPQLGAAQRTPSDPGHTAGEPGWGYRAGPRPRCGHRAAELCDPSPKDLARAGASQGSSCAPALPPAGTPSSDGSAGKAINFHPSGLLLGKFAN